MSAADDKKKARLAIVDQIADLVLDDMLSAAKTGGLTAADRKVFLDFLKGAGLDLDPKSVSDKLDGLMTSRPQFNDPPDDGEFRPKLNIV